MEVDSELLISTRLESYLADIKRKLREERIGISRSEITDNRIIFTTRTDATDQLDDYLKRNIDLEYRKQDNNQFIVEYNEQGLDDLIDYAVSQNLVTLRNLSLIHI